MSDKRLNSARGRIEAVLDAISNIAIGDIDIGDIVAGDASAANQVAGNTSLASIDTKMSTLAGYVDGLEAAIASLNGNVDGVEALLTTLNNNSDAVESLLTAVKTAAEGATPAGDNQIGKVGSPVDLITVTPTVLNADAYDAGDVVFDSVAITNAVRVNAGSAMLQSIVVADKGDVKAELRLVFLDSNASLGTKDAAPSISDANGLKVLGTVEVTAADYVDLGGISVATLRGIGLLVQAAAGSRDIYVAAFSTGTPTYATSDLQLRLGFLQG